MQNINLLCVDINLLSVDINLLITIDKSQKIWYNYIRGEFYMRKADDIQRKKIVEFYLQCENYSETARNFGLSTPTVKKIVEACDIITLLREKKAENTAQIVSMMDDKTGKVLQIIDRYLTEALNETKIEKTNLKDLFTAYGIIIDKQFKAEEIKLNRERLKLEREKLEHTKKNGIQDDDVIEVVVKRKELSA